MQKIFTVVLVGLLAILLTENVGAQFPSVTTQFVNATQGERASSVIWINFSAGGAASVNAATGTVAYDASSAIGTANIWNGSSYAPTSIYTNSAYQLSTIQNGEVSISTFGGGRAYVSYGPSGMANITNSTYSPVIGPYPGWQPAPATPDQNFTSRFQAFELTVQPTVIGSTGSYAFSQTNQAYADLSYIDQVSISTGIQVLNAPTGTTNPTQTSANTQALVNAVQVYNTGAASPTTFTAGTNVVTTAASGQPQYFQVAGSAIPSGYTNPGSTSIANPAPNLTTFSNFVRVAGPGQMPTVGGPTGSTTVYHPWDNYIAALTPGGSLNSAGTLVTSLAGSYGPTGVPAQPYAANATFHSGNVTLGTTVYTGYVLISGFTYNGAAQSDIYVPFSSLTASTGLYGTNPSYSINQAALVTVPGNTLQTRVVGDVVAGMNFGTLGSTTQTTYNGTTQALGAFSSQDWWAIGTSSPNLLFGGAQTNTDFYNTYAASLQSLTSAYAFGIQDRLGQNTTEFNLTTGDGFNSTVLQFLIQPDLAAVPEPGTCALLVVGLGAVVLRCRKSRT